MSNLELALPKITNGNASIEAAYLDYCNELLGYGAHLRNLFEAADAFPECKLINAHAAILHLAFEGAEGWQWARPYLDRLGNEFTDLNEHEAAFCDAVCSWARKDFHGTHERFKAIANKWPTDLISIKWGQYHAFNLGHQASLLSLGETAVKTAPNLPYVHGLYAFALEQNHQLEEAEKQARHAIEIAIDDAWAHHAVAHVMDTQNRISEGISWLDHCAHFWDQKGTFIREHNWWHAALFNLRKGDHARALEVFDTHLWGEWPEFPQEQIGAASILWRFELSGANVGDRWQPVVEQARARMGENLLPFHDLHYLFALSKSDCDEDADGHLQAISTHAEQCCNVTSPAWQNACVPAATGIIAYARADFERAARELEAAAPHMNAIGGSHAQRAIFAETLHSARQRASGVSLALAE